MTTAQRSRIRTSLKIARDYAIKAQQAESSLLREIADITGAELSEIPTDAENATNLEEAITCFLSYGEYDINSILNEIQNAQERG